MRFLERICFMASVFELSFGVGLEAQSKTRLRNQQQVVPYPRIGKRYDLTNMGDGYYDAPYLVGHPVYQMPAMLDVRDISLNTRGAAMMDDDIFIWQNMLFPRHYPAKRNSKKFQKSIPFIWPRHTPLHTDRKWEWVRRWG